MKRHEQHSENFSRKAGRRHKGDAGRAIGTIAGGTLKGAVKTGATTGTAAALTGAGAGALLGTLVAPGIGTAVGAGIGAAGGAIAGTPVGMKLGAIYGASKASTRVAKGNYSEGEGQENFAIQKIGALAKLGRGIGGAVGGAGKVVAGTVSGLSKKVVAGTVSGLSKMVTKPSQFFFGGKGSKVTHKITGAGGKVVREGNYYGLSSIGRSKYTNKNWGMKTFDKVLDATRNRTAARAAAHVVDNRGRYVVGGLGVMAARSAGNDNYADKGNFAQGYIDTMNEMGDARRDWRNKNRKKVYGLNIGLPAAAGGAIGATHTGAINALGRSGYAQGMRIGGKKIRNAKQFKKVRWKENKKRKTV